MYEHPQQCSVYDPAFQLDEEKLKHASLAQENGFAPVHLHNLLRPVKGAARLCTCQRRV
jgi:hypothetical protein